MRFLLLLFSTVALLVSSCHHSDFYKSHYPKSLKHSRNSHSEKDAPLVSNIEIQVGSVQFSDELHVQNETPDSIETQTIILEETLIDNSELTLENLNAFAENKNSNIYLEKNQVNYPESNSAHQTSVEEEPKTDSPKKRTFNRKSVLAFWMVCIILFVGMVFLPLNLLDYPLIGIPLVIGLIIGCIFTIIKAIRGAKEISKDKENQKGTALSVLAIVGSIIGLVFSGLGALIFIYIMLYY